MLDTRAINSNWQANVANLENFNIGMTGPSRPFSFGIEQQSAGIFGNLFGFATRAASDVGNFMVPNVKPDVSHAMKLYYGGKITAAQLGSYLRIYGISWRQGGVLSGIDSYWENAIELGRPIYSLEFAVSLYHQGTLDSVALKEITQRHGYGDPKATEKFQSQYPPMPFQWVKQQYYLNEIQGFSAPKEVARLGYAREDRGVWLLDSNDPLSIPNAALLFFRGFIDAGRFEKNIQASGYPNEQLAESIRKASHLIPGYTDLVRFAVKEVWDEQVVAALGYDQEFPERFEYWMRAQGISYRPRDVMPNYPFEDDLTFAKAYWRAHWDPISPTQAYTMYHRLRPERVQRYIDQGFNLRTPANQPKPFLLDDVRQWLKIADYPPGIRDYLAAISHSPLRLVDIRRALQLHQLTFIDPTLGQRLPPDVFAALARYGRQWAIDQFRDRGLHPDDAAAVADIAIAEVTNEAAKPLASLRRNITTAVVKDILEQYQLGIMERGVAEQRLAQAGIGAQLAASYLSLEDSKYRKNQIKQFVRWLHSEYVMGKYNTEEAVNALTGMGIKEFTARGTVNQWIYQFFYRRRVASTEKIQRWLSAGLITFEDASLRLFNLGWQQPEIILLMQESQQQIAQTQARVLASAERNRAAQAKEIENNIRRTANEIKAMQATLRTLTPATTLQRWLRKEIVSEPYVRTRMAASGYDPDAIERYVRDARNGTTTTQTTGPTTGQEEPSQAGAESAEPEPGEGL